MNNFAARRKKVFALLKEEGIEALVIDNVTDIYYLTGLVLSLGRLLITQKQALLFVDGRYFEAAKRAVELPVFLTQGYGKKSAFAQEITSLKGKVAFDATTTPFFRAKELFSVLGSEKRGFALPSPLKGLRAVKDRSELTFLRQAANLATKGYRYLLTQLQEGITEIEVVNRLKTFWLENGGEEVAFPPIIAFGKGGADPHYHPGKKRLAKGDGVLIDIGVFKNRYASDMTRVVFFGEPKPKLKEIYGIVKKAMQTTLQLCRPGVEVGKLDQAAREVITKAGYGPYFTHSLGHGVGLETHESPFLKNQPPFAKVRLKEGMVITVEPGIYLPQLGGVRIEDTIVITKTGFVSLTAPTKQLVVL